jgi:hypothetical protein
MPAPVHHNKKHKAKGDAATMLYSDFHTSQI